MRRWSLLGLLLLGLLSWGPAGVLAGPPEFVDVFGAGATPTEPPLENPVTVWVSGPTRPAAPGSKVVVEIHFDVAEHSYVNQEMLSVKPEPLEGATFEELVAPEPETKAVASLGKVARIYKHNFHADLPIALSPEASPGPRELSFKVRYQACNESVCFIPKTEKLSFTFSIAGQAQPAPITAPQVIQPNGQPPAPASEFERQLQRGWLWAYLFAFFGGILASLTPCVYPMIPITMAVIGARKAKSRRESFQLSLVFVLGIAFIYSLLGVTAAATGNVFGGLMQNSYVVGFVSLLFAALALGMLGFYDMELPPAVQTRLNQMGGKGYGGSFIVGMVTGVVASPCVGPVLVGMLGWVATAAANPAYSKLTSLSLGFSLLFVFALGLGMLFLVIGTFTGLLVSLPKSGGWMIRVKHALGILLFAVAWFYASPLLPTWAPPVLLAPGLLLLATGELEGAREKKLSTAWMAAGSAYLFLLGLGAVLPGSVSTGWLPASQVKSSALESVAWLHSEKEGLGRASREKKPMLLDFYADWCIACKELDLYTYSDPEVSRVLTGFVSVKIDGTDDSGPEIQRLYSFYKVLGLPTVVFLDSSGKILPDLTLTGFEPADAFLKRLERAAAPR